MTSLRSLASLPLFAMRSGAVVGASSLMRLFSRSAVQTLHRVGGELLHTAQVPADLVDGRVRARDAGRDADAVVLRTEDGVALQLGIVLAESVQVSADA